MKKTTLILALLPWAALAEEIDGIAAKVGNEVILKSDVIMEMRRANISSADMYEKIRDEIIDRKLILKAANEAKLTLQDWLVDNRVREIIDRAFDGDRNKLMETLSQQKISYPEWYQRMKDDMIVSAMRWNTVDKYVSASPAAMREEYLAHPEKYSTPGIVTVSVILLRPEDAGLREKISAALKDEDFAELARRFSADSHAAEGGVWKDVRPSEVFKSEVCEEIAKMPKGTLSHWVEIGGWSFLLRKDDETKGRARTFEEAYEDVEATVKNELANRMQDEWFKRLREETFVRVY